MHEIKTHHVAGQIDVRARKDLEKVVGVSQDY